MKLLLISLLILLYIRIANANRIVNDKSLISSSNNDNKININEQHRHKHLHIGGVELLDRYDILDRLLAFFEDPRTDLFVGVVAGSFAIYEVIQDFQKMGTAHSLAIMTLLHSIKSFMSVLKESKR